MASVEEAKTMCEEKDAELAAEVKTITLQQVKVGAESDELKKKLYAKFGSQIMLEEN
jgi:chaperonin cofactor prefoldin